MLESTEIGVMWILPTGGISLVCHTAEDVLTSSWKLWLAVNYCPDPTVTRTIGDASPSLEVGVVVWRRGRSLFEPLARNLWCNEALFRRKCILSFLRTALDLLEFCLSLPFPTCTSQESQGLFINRFLSH